MKLREFSDAQNTDTPELGGVVRYATTVRPVLGINRNGLACRLPDGSPSWREITEEERKGDGYSPKRFGWSTHTLDPADVVLPPGYEFDPVSETYRRVTRDHDGNITMIATVDHLKLDVPIVHPREGTPR